MNKKTLQQLDMEIELTKQWLRAYRKKEERLPVFKKLQDLFHEYNTLLAEEMKKKADVA